MTANARTLSDIAQERQRERALNLAVKWAADRGTSTGTHPGTAGILDVAEAFLQFLTGQEDTAEEEGADDD